VNAELSHNVKVESQGYNLYTITYTNRNPVVAQKVLQSVIYNYALLSQQFSVTEGQRYLHLYQVQLAQAQQELNNATNAEVQYVKLHPELSRADFATDPKYGELQARTVQAETMVGNIKVTIAAINDEIAAQGSGSSSLFQVIDTPVAASDPVPRIKEFLIAGGIGLSIGLVACALYLIILLRREHTVYSAVEVQEAAIFPVIMQLPRLQIKSKTLLQLVNSSTVHPR
jgi:thiol:disulfide interchange protein